MNENVQDQNQAAHQVMNQSKDPEADTPTEQVNRTIPSIMVLPMVRSPK